jgi:hypothetical protein
LAKIDGVLGLKARHEPVDDAAVEIFAAQERIAGGGDDFEDPTLADLEDGDVERSTAEVVDSDGLIETLAETVGERGGRRLVDDADHLEAGDQPGVFGGLALVVVEIRGHRDHRFGHRLPQEIFGDDFHLLQHHRADLGDRILLVAQLDPKVAVGALDDAVARRQNAVLHLRRGPFAADEALGRRDRVFGIGDGLALGDMTDQTLARLGESDHRRRRCPTSTIGDHGRLVVLHDGDARIRRAKINADHSFHEAFSGGGDLLQAF